MYEIDNVYAIYHCRCCFIKLSIIVTSRRHFSTQCPYKHSKQHLPELTFVFNIPPTAKVIWRRATAKFLIRQTGEPREPTCDPWFTRQVVYPLHHSGSYLPGQTDRIGSVRSGSTLIESILLTEWQCLKKDKNDLYKAITLLKCVMLLTLTCRNIGRHMAVTPFKFPPLFRKPKTVEIPKRLGVRVVVVASSNNFLLTLQDVLNPDLSFIFGKKQVI